MTRQKKDEYASLNSALGVSFIIMHSESQSYRPSAKSYITHLAANRYQKQPIKICHQFFWVFFFKEWLQGTLEMSLSPLAAIAKSLCRLDHCFYYKKNLEWILSAMLNRLTLPHKNSFLPPAPSHSSPQYQVILFLAQKEVSRETVKGGVPQSWPTTFLHTFNKTIIFKALCFLKIEDFNQEAQWITGENAVIDEKEYSRFVAARMGKT